MILSITRHELRQVFGKAKTWYCLAVLQALLAVIFNWLISNFLKNQAITDTMHYGITEEVLHPFYAWFALLALILLPMLATQMLCAEKQRGTIVNYYCAPITPMQVILGKFFTLNILLVMLLAYSSVMPLSIMRSGALDWGQYISSLVGVYLMLSAAMAICLSLSSMFANVIRANMLILIALASFVLLEWAAQYTGRHAMFLQTFGLLKPLKGFLAGVITLRATAYYSLLVLGFLCLGSWGYARRWQ
ncbi:MAG TPA: ABC transporter permease [Gammaproteobacteria bacterium]|nr:ABC transporter permease [Gammaproteobacteria bacterium]